MPIYGRGAENPAPAADAEKSQPLPARPPGQRPTPVLLQVRGAGTVGTAGLGKATCEPLMTPPSCCVAQQPSPAPAAPAAAAQQNRISSIFGFQVSAILCHLSLQPPAITDCSLPACAQLGPGQGYVEALTPEQQHQVRGCSCWGAHVCHFLRRAYLQGSHSAVMMCSSAATLENGN